MIPKLNVMSTVFKVNNKKTRPKFRFSGVFGRHKNALLPLMLTLGTFSTTFTTLIHYSYFEQTYTTFTIFNLLLLLLPANKKLAADFSLAWENLLVLTCDVLLLCAFLLLFSFLLQYVFLRAAWHIGLALVDLAQTSQNK